MVTRLHLPGRTRVPKAPSIRDIAGVMGLDMAPFWNAKGRGGRRSQTAAARRRVTSLRWCSCIRGFAPTAHAAGAPRRRLSPRSSGCTATRFASAAQYQMPCGSASNQKAPRRPTPFDNVMAHTFDWDHNGGRGQMELLLGQLHQFAHSSPEDAPRLAGSFSALPPITLRPTNPFLTQFTVNSLAMDFLRRGEETLPYALDERGTEASDKRVKSGPGGSSTNASRSSQGPKKPS